MAAAPGLTALSPCTIYASDPMGIPRTLTHGRLGTACAGCSG